MKFSRAEESEKPHMHFLFNTAADNPMLRNQSQKIQFLSEFQKFGVTTPMSMK